MSESEVLKMRQNDILKSQILGFETLMRALSSRNDRSITDQRVMDSRIRNQISLELVQVDIQSTIKAKRRRDRADNLSNQAVEMLERWARNIQVPAADIVNGLIIYQKCAVGVLDCAVRAENGVIGLDDSCRDSWSGVHGEFELGFLAIVGGETFEQEGAETRTSSTAKRVEDQETL